MQENHYTYIVLSSEIEIISSMNKSTINAEEVKKFENMAKEWWNLNGPFKPLHMMNPARIEFVIDEIKSNFRDSENQDISILDIGCGGGIIAEPLSELNFNVDAIDASDVNIEIAKSHQKISNSKVNYMCNTAENISLMQKKYDVILALEIIEHIDNISLFLESLSKLANKNAIIIISTINKNILSFISGIVIAEYLLKWVPKKTHSWSKFIKPSIIANEMLKHSFTTKNLKGISYKPLRKNWELSSNTDINYIMSLTKN